MNTTHMLTSVSVAEVLTRIAAALRVPVLVLALLALLLCALETGRFVWEYSTRMRTGRLALRRLVAQVIADPSRAAGFSRRAPTQLSADALLQIARALLAGDPAAIEHALADYELASQRRLERTRILVRAGPALGLMGTLIPLAPGLAALGHGNITTLATDLRTAFAATTIGLLVGTIAYALTLTRTRMYSEDLAALEHATTPPPGHTTSIQPPTRPALPVSAPREPTAHTANGQAQPLQPQGTTPLATQAQQKPPAEPSA